MFLMPVKVVGRGVFSAGDSIHHQRTRVFCSCECLMVFVCGRFRFISLQQQWSD
jgi:hypothetical protein